MPSKVLGLLLALLFAPTVALAQSSEPVVEETVPVEEVVVDQASPVVEVAPALVATVQSTARNARLFPDPTIAGRGVNSVPSPVGVPIFEQITASRTAVQLRLARDEMATYVYPCNGQQCAGSALSVWSAIPIQQRHDYLAAAVDAFKAVTPNAPRIDVQVRVGLNGDMVECATTATGELTFVDGACPR